MSNSQIILTTSFLKVMNILKTLKTLWISSLDLTRNVCVRNSNDAENKKNEFIRHL